MSTPPIFDAYKFAADIIRSARKSIILIDNYVDESVLLMLSKRDVGVSAIIYTGRVSEQFKLDMAKHNSQYEPVMVYHIGASLKDLGKKMFAFSRLKIPAEMITDSL